MLGPHIFGCCLVILLKMDISALQSARCSSLAREARYSSTLASVGLVLFSAIAVPLTVRLAAPNACASAAATPLERRFRRRWVTVRQRVPLGTSSTAW